ncbi:hypothetical protein H4R21_005796 [Coemansia helicoidea]|uniref:Uncharacterized protein n=1 Tax=Coemansia helicoidea TaxID=1286919 RepID=A0ACC1KRD3_9FUNG|nr:hypothetical protein H4R21_005796 [Coemansia helicoidea]
MCPPFPQRPARDVIGAGDLERLVVVAGPCSVLPGGRRRMEVESGPAYRPVVESHDGAERLYAKHGLPLFETLDAERAARSEAGEQRTDDGPVAAVLLRRRARRARLPGSDVLEDVSDQHYQKLHRKPEYVEKRVRNREIELYKYARWQEGQRLESERRRQQLLGRGHGAHTPAGDGAGGAGNEAGTQPPSGHASPLPSAAEPTLGGDGSPQGPRKRARHVVDARLGLMTLRDGSGPPPRGGGESNAQASASGESTAGDAAETGSVAAGPGAGAAATEAQVLLTESERQAAHLGGCILEQFMVLAARLPVQTLLESPAATDDESSDSSSSSSSVSDDSDDNSGSDNSDSSPESADASDGEQDASEAGCPGCAQCCPREFVLPQRLFGHLLRQRDAERDG